MKLSYHKAFKSLSKLPSGVIEREDKTLAFVQYDTPARKYLGVKTTKKVIGNAINIILRKRVNPHPMLQPVTDKLIKPKGPNKSGMENRIFKFTGFKAKFK